MGTNKNRRLIVNNATILGGQTLVYNADDRDDERLRERDIATFYVVVSSVVGSPTIVGKLLNRTMIGSAGGVVFFTAVSNTLKSANNGDKDVIPVGYTVSTDGDYVATQGTLARIHSGYRVEIENTAGGGNDVNITVEVHYSRVTGG